jgi:hypothetical protein
MCDWFGCRHRSVRKLTDYTGEVWARYCDYHADCVRGFMREGY